ncbi:MAG: hypothetical protein M1837_002148 [Sclerophora amabilis]|nr:MAG: hypothetical protein M1837_002148 [Sclerophora amabilis]
MRSRLIVSRLRCESPPDEYASENEEEKAEKYSNEAGEPANAGPQLKLVKRALPIFSFEEQSPFSGLIRDIEELIHELTQAEPARSSFHLLSRSENCREEVPRLIRDLRVVNAAGEQAQKRRISTWRSPLPLIATSEGREKAVANEDSKDGAVDQSDNRCLTNGGKDCQGHGGAAKCQDESGTEDPTLVEGHCSMVLRCGEASARCSICKTRSREIQSDSDQGEASEDSEDVKMEEDWMPQEDDTETGSRENDAVPYVEESRHEFEREAFGRGKGTTDGTSGPLGQRNLPYSAKDFPSAKGHKDKLE